MWLTFRRAARRAAPWLLMIGAIYWMRMPGGAEAAFPRGASLPELSVDVSDGSRLVLPLARDAKSTPVLVLNFWASYCAPCREEAPIFASLQKRSAEVRVIGLSIEGLSKPDMLRAAGQLGMAYPIAACDRALLQKLRVNAVPTTYVIAKDGSITLSRVGAVTQGELEAAIESAKRRG
jgi:cytochrome c biogenesis protein CcmG/thiol:disulfide interchange protein DsbE